MSNINKILVVGDKLTGKSSIINGFKTFQPLNPCHNDSVTDSTSNTANAAIRFN